MSHKFSGVTPLMWNELITDLNERLNPSVILMMIWPGEVGFYGKNDMYFAMFVDDTNGKIRFSFANTESVFNAKISFQELLDNKAILDNLPDGFIESIMFHMNLMD
jgi:hypothetical protein